MPLSVRTGKRRLTVELPLSLTVALSGFGGGYGVVYLKLNTPNSRSSTLIFLGNTWEFFYSGTRHMPFQLPGWWNWRVTYVLVLVVMLSALYYSLRPFPLDSPSITASVAWGIVTLMLCLMFMLGAAQTP